jgi:hypothetical protein
MPQITEGALHQQAHDNAVAARDAAQAAEAYASALSAARLSVEQREAEVADRQEHLAAPGLDELQHSRMATALAISIQRLEWARAALTAIEQEQS